MNLKKKEIQRGFSLPSKTQEEAETYLLQILKEQQAFACPILAHHH